MCSGRHRGHVIELRRSAEKRLIARPDKLVERAGGFFALELRRQLEARDVASACLSKLTRKLERGAAAGGKT